MPSTVYADDSLRTHASLIERLRDLDDNETWSRFYSTYVSAVHSHARKRGLSDAEAEEVAQEVFKRIAETIHNFELGPRAGSFRRWLYQLARWRADDKLRERERLTPDLVAHTGTTVHHTIGLGFSNSVEQSLEADARRHLIQAALDRLRNRINPRDLQIFQHLVIEEWPVTRIAEFFRIRPALVYVIRHRVARQLRSELELIERRLNRPGPGPGPASPRAR